VVIPAPMFPGGGVVVGSDLSAASLELAETIARQLAQTKKSGSRTRAGSGGKMGLVGLEPTT
jgi:hypothetical protein